MNKVIRARRCILEYYGDSILPVWYPRLSTKIKETTVPKSRALRRLWAQKFIKEV